MTFNRLNILELIEKIRSGHSLLLLGPRQTGKTTLMEMIEAQLPQRPCLRYNLQLPNIQEAIENNPESLISEVESIRRDEKVMLFLDEIQNVPKVLGVLQHLLDQKKIVLMATGSSARKMRKVGANWLPGRIQLHHLYPLLWEETGWADKRFPEFLRYGGLPGILSEDNLLEREQVLSSYVHLYLEEEIRREAWVRNIPQFTKFLRLGALESGGAPNLSKLGQQVGLTHPTIREYYQILEDTLIVHRLDSFGSRRDEVLKSPRYYFFDLGVRNAAANVGHSEGMLTLQMGKLFEHFIVLEMICRWNRQALFYFWRSKYGEEVDLIVEKQNGLVACEIKTTKNPVESDFKGLTAFAKKNACRAAYLICQVERPRKFGTLEAIPWQQMHHSIQAT